MFTCWLFDYTFVIIQSLLLWRIFCINTQMHVAYLYRIEIQDRHMSRSFCLVICFYTLCLSMHFIVENCVYSDCIYCMYMIVYLYEDWSPWWEVYRYSHKQENVYQYFLLSYKVVTYVHKVRRLLPCYNWQIL